MLSVSVLAIALLASSSVTPDKGDGYTASLDVCNSSDPHQQWTLRDAWGANNTLINVALGTDTKCLDIQGWKVDNEGNPAQSWHCCCEDKQSLCPGHCGYPDKNYNEQWTFEAATGHLRVFGSDRKPGLCLEAKAAQAGAELQLWECTSAHTTVNTWTVNEAKDGPLLRLVAHDDDGDNFCLTTKPGSPPPSPGPPPAPATPPCANASLSEFPWCNASLSFEARAALLAGALTPAELVEQISTFSFTSNHSGTVPGVERVRLPPYNYHSEGLHGVRDSCDGPATVWPQVVGMAATGNLTLVHEMGKYMGLGFRAARNALGGGKLPAKGCGLSVYGPTMNLIRDARWGRNQEVPGEDPYLTSEYGSYIISGETNGWHQAYVLADERYVQRRSSRGSTRDTSPRRAR